MMRTTVELPEDLLQRVNPGREALEALSHHQAARLLGLNRFEFDGFLKERGIMDHAYDIEDLEQDIATLKSLGRIN